MGLRPVVGLDDRVRVVLSEPHCLLREGVAAALEAEGDIDVVGQADTVEEAIRLAERLQPDVLVVEEGDVANTTARLRRCAPGCRVVVLAAADDLPFLLGALEAGANAFVSKTSALQELIGATRAASRGETSVPPRLLGPVLDELLRRRQSQQDAYERLARLTAREREVLEILSTGANNAAIAEALTISPETARTHVQNVLSKLGVHSRLEAVAFVRSNDLRLRIPDVDPAPLGSRTDAEPLHLA